MREYEGEGIDHLGPLDKRFKIRLARCKKARKTDKLEQCRIWVVAGKGLPYKLWDNILEKPPSPDRLEVIDIITDLHQMINRPVYISYAALYEFFLDRLFNRRFNIPENTAHNITTCLSFSSRLTPSMDMEK